MLDLFEIKPEGRLHPLLYRITLGSFALVRLWDGTSLRGPERGRAFEIALYDYCETPGASLCERAGSRTICGVASASGLRHENDGVIAAPDIILHVEAKHLSGEVSKNDLLIFNQKALDFVLTGDPRIRTRPLYRLFVSGSPLSREARRFALLWGIVVIEPDMLPLPVLHWLAGSALAFRAELQDSAARLWREIPGLISPLQERLRRLPRCIAGVEHVISTGRLDSALDILQDGCGFRWWRELDGHDPSWLERVYVDVMGQQRSLGDWSRGLAA
jgi:hypothetical protein